MSGEIVFCRVCSRLKFKMNFLPLCMFLEKSSRFNSILGFHIYIYIYIYVCVCVCVRVFVFYVLGSCDRES